MNTLTKILLTPLALLTLATTLVAGPIIAGPKGGKILTAAAPHVEFFITPDRTVQVSFYSDDLKPLPATAQVVTAIAETPSGKVNLTFTLKNGSLVSTAPLPEGDGYRVVLQVRDTAEARPKNYRVELHAGTCGGCKLAEYACTCDDHDH